jgi:hypothetical protein
MKRSNYIFEFEDLSWFPDTIRLSMTDYLRYVLTILNFYQPITPLLIEGLHQTSSTRIIDLCSGGGGAIEQIKNNVEQQSRSKIQITLTDKYPNRSAFEFLAAKTKGSISYSDISVDATDVPADLKGFRTIFSGFHHFNNSAATSVIKNAVDAKSGIGIFDGGDKNIFVILGISLLHPIAFFFLTPFFKPFRYSRIFFTYLIPIIPLCTIWDGMISITRLYKPTELLKIARQVDNENYVWKAGKVKNKLRMNVAYLIGYPLQKKEVNK